MILVDVLCQTLHHNLHKQVSNVAYNLCRLNSKSKSLPLCFAQEAIRQVLCYFFRDLALCSSFYCGCSFDCDCSYGCGFGFGYDCNCDCGCDYGCETSFCSDRFGYATVIEGRLESGSACEGVIRSGEGCVIESADP